MLQMSLDSLISAKEKEIRFHNITGLPLLTSEEALQNMKQASSRKYLSTIQLKTKISEEKSIFSLVFFSIVMHNPTLFGRKIPQLRRICEGKTTNSDCRSQRSTLSR